MKTDDIQEILQRIHEIEQNEFRMIGRKELHKHMPAGLTYQEKGILIRSWSASYFGRLQNMWKARAKHELAVSLTKYVTKR